MTSKAVETNPPPFTSDPVTLTSHVVEELSAKASPGKHAKFGAAAQVASLNC
jgi:hypothetical protein